MVSYRATKLEECQLDLRHLVSGVLSHDIGVMSAASVIICNDDVGH